MTSILRILLLLGLPVFATCGGLAGPSPVEQHGRLRAQGNRIVGEHGRPVSLAGTSLFWSQWKGQFYNARCIDWLKQDWQVTIVRAAMAIEEGGYLTNPAAEKARVIAAVEASLAAGLYVIVDWHDHHAHRHTAEAVAFFGELARRYGQHPNLIYEIYNEPLDTASWPKDVKPYSEAVIAAIRAQDPDNLVLVGSPRWSQDVDVAAADPVRDPNVAYALHFYAATHKEPLRAKARVALEKGVPLFVSEWGTCAADGDGAADAASTAEWMAFMRQWNLSHCNWAVSDKAEAASIVVPGAAPTGGWTDAELTRSGRIVREWIRGWGEAPAVSPVAVPAVVPRP